MNPKPTEVDLEAAIAVGRPEADGVAAKGTADPEWMPAEANVAITVDAAHEIVRGILNGRQRAWKAARAEAIAGGGDRELERIVRTLTVVLVAPRIELRLPVRKVRQGRARQQLRAEWGWQ